MLYTDMSIQLMLVGSQPVTPDKNSYNASIENGEFSKMNLLTNVS